MRYVAIFTLGVLFGMAGTRAHYYAERLTLEETSARVVEDVRQATEAASARKESEAVFERKFNRCMNANAQLARKCIR